jgi:hypothetical protein
MVNGEWANSSSSTLLLLEGPHKRGQHSTNPITALGQPHTPCLRQSDTNRQNHMRFELFKRPLRDPKKLDERARLLAAKTFRDVGRNTIHDFFSSPGST